MAINNNQKPLLAYFDCQFGASGDMLLACLLDLNIDFSLWLNEINKIDVIKSNAKISLAKVKRCGINANKLVIDQIKLDDSERNLNEIVNIINSAGFDQSITNLANTIFTTLARAEARVHGIAIDEVHFHEIGSIDSIIDIVGFAIAYKWLGIDESHTSYLTTGFGQVNTRHGNYPVPAPATLELIKLFNMPVNNFKTNIEALTPTAAAILATITSKFTETCLLNKIDKVSYGAGAKDPSDYPNITRVMLGVNDDNLVNSPFLSDEIVVLETNIDDISPNILGYVLENLLTNGANDAYITPCLMKKNRLGHLLTVICTQAKQAILEKIIFTETTTLGIRNYKSKRNILNREIKKIEIEPGHFVNVKISYNNDIDLIKIEPEYDDCVNYARIKKLPLKDVMERIKGFKWTQ